MELASDNLDITVQIARLEKYLSLLLCLTDIVSQNEEDSIQYGVNIQTFLVKYGLATKSLINSIDGVSIRYGENAINNEIDLSSLMIIGRSIIENYLNIYYLFFHETKNEDLKKFKNLLFQLSSLGKRQNFKTNDSIQRLKSDKEKELFVDYLSQIKTTDTFRNLSSKKKKQIDTEKIDRIPAKIHSWFELFDYSKISNNLFFEYWKLYSNYAHSEYISIIHLQEVYKNVDLMNFVLYNSYHIQNMLIGHLVTNICEEFVSANSYFESQDIELRSEIEIWNNIATVEENKSA